MVGLEKSYSSSQNSVLLLCKISSLILMYTSSLNVACRKDYYCCFPSLNVPMLSSFVPVITKCHLPKSGSEMENALLIDKRCKRLRGKKPYSE